MIALVLGILSTIVPPQSGTDDGLADHHLHALSPVLIKHWKEAGARFSRDDSSYSDPVTFCDKHKIQQGFLISMAHLYSTERLLRSARVKDHEQQLVSEENDFIARQVVKAPKRFVGFFSVNPLREWAFDELERCRKVAGLRGLKLHFPACGVNLHDDAHMKTLRQVFAWATRNDVPLLVHISGFERPFAEAESKRFWQELVKPNQGLHLHVAHLGGSGGYNDRSAAVLNGFTKYLSDKARSTVYFDLSGAILVEDVDGVGPTSDENCRRLAEHMLSVGLDRFLFASDYPVFSPTDFKAALRKKLPLSDANFALLFSNRSPLFGSPLHMK